LFFFTNFCYPNRKIVRPVPMKDAD